jgi:phosphoglycerate dehydrogenase-like enzyme
VDREVRSGEWSQLTRQHSELAGKTWGIVGFGRIGKHVARRLTGWDVDVVYYDTGRAEPDEERALDATWAELDDLLARADVVSLHVPLVDATTGLLDDARLRLMKPTAYLVNVSRGGVVDEPALVDALQHQRLRGAALDVFAEEPLPSAHAFTGLDNVILTPHSAGTVMEAQIRIMELVAANVGRVVRGEPPIDVVNGVEPAIGNATT